MTIYRNLVKRYNDQNRRELWVFYTTYKIFPTDHLLAQDATRGELYVSRPVFRGERIVNACRGIPYSGWLMDEDADNFTWKFDDYYNVICDIAWRVALNNEEVGEAIVKEIEKRFAAVPAPLTALTSSVFQFQLLRELVKIYNISTRTTRLRYGTGAQQNSITLERFFRDLSYIPSFSAEALFVSETTEVLW